MSPGGGCVRRGSDTLSSDIEGPCEYKCNWEADEQQHDHHAQRPVWQFPCWKRRRRKLDDAACCDDVGRSHPIYPAPSHFSKEPGQGYRFLVREHKTKGLSY